MGVSNAGELEKTMSVWRSILDGLEGGEETVKLAGRWKRDHEWSANRKHGVQIMADGIQEHLAEYLDFAWDSPGKDYVNKRAAEKSSMQSQAEDASWLTPAQSPRAEQDLPEELSLSLR
jgi:D-arabinose 1-dehydrogenase